MRGKHFLYWAFVLLTVSCVKEEEGMEKTGPEPVARSVNFAAGTDDVEVLIFGRNDTYFTYLGRVSQGWDAEGKTSVGLEVGDYKFLFYKSARLNTQVSPGLQAGTKAEEVKIVLREDAAHPDYHLPADEVFLPETLEMAERIYEIRGGETVRNTLTRAVGRIVVELKRGASENGVIDSLPYEEGSNILDDIEGITLDISNVGEAVSPAGASGSTRTLWVSSEASVFPESGFAVFDGPFVFPPEDAGETTVVLTLFPKAGSAFPEMVQTVQGKVERNKKLVITLWVTSTYRFIGITVHTDPISETTEGDQGIWE